AALVLIVGMRLEVQFGPRQLVVRWGGGPPPVVETPVPPAPALPFVEQERLRVMQELIHALAEDLDHRDDRQSQNLVRWQQQIEASHWRVLRRLESAENDLRALYTAQFGSRTETGGE